MKSLFTLLTLLLLTATVVLAENKPKANKATNTNNVTSYDFTTGSDKYYGGANGAKEIETGVWGMIAGDANQSGIISNSDVDPINSNINNSGYYDSDVNLSGIVTNSDVDFVNSNINKSSQVPN